MREYPPARARHAAWRRGQLAERVAACWLRLKGYSILARGLRTPFGEIDLIVRRGHLLAFVEVKHRATAEAAIEAISPRQCRRIERAASAFLASRPDLEGLSLRFDALVLMPWRLPRHLPDAWRPQAS